MSIWNLSWFVPCAAKVIQSLWLVLLSSDKLIAQLCQENIPSNKTSKKNQYQTFGKYDRALDSESRGPRFDYLNGGTVLYP